MILRVICDTRHTTHPLTCLQPTTSQPCTTKKTAGKVCAIRMSPRDKRSARKEESIHLRQRGRPGRVTKEDEQLKHHTKKIVAQYILARRKREKSHIIRKVLKKWIGEKSLSAISRAHYEKLHRRVLDEMKGNVKKLMNCEGGSRNRKTKKDVAMLIEWRKKLDLSASLLCENKDRMIGSINPVRWSQQGGSNDSMRSLSKNLCLVTLFENTSAFIAGEISSAGILRKILQIPEQRKAEPKKKRYYQRFKSGSFYEDEVTDWVAFNIPLLNRYSDITFILPSNETTHEQVLRLLGDAGIDIVLRGLGARFDKEILDVTQAYFYIVKNCWDDYKHEDFRTAGCDRFNVLIPLILSGDDGHGLLLWDEYGKDRKNGFGGVELSAKYKYRYDEGVIIGEGVKHSTCTASDIRVMMCICIQSLPRKRTGKQWGDFTWVPEEAFPNPNKHWNYLQINRGKHFKRDDANASLHQQKYEREIFSKAK